jgi:hypothetical protein
MRSGHGPTDGSGESEETCIPPPPPKKKEVKTQDLIW